MPYSRKELVDLRNSQQPSQDVVQLIPKELRRGNDAAKQQQPVICYTRQQLVAIRDQVSEHHADDQPSTSSCLPDSVVPHQIPDELRRLSRFRCDSNCMNEQQHEHKKILKYTRNELLRYKQQAMQSCAAQTRALEATAPEIFLRSLGR